MPALFPMMSAAETWRPGDCVRKWITESAVTPFTGLVTAVVPATCKIWVQWPIEHSQEDPEHLIRVNPLFAGMPVALQDKGYSSYEKERSKKRFGPSPLPERTKAGQLPLMRTAATQKMAIRIAHDFADNTIGQVVKDVAACKDQGLSDVRAYDYVYRKYGSYCSDHVVRMAVEKVYE